MTAPNERQNMQEIELHSRDPEAVAALRATVKGLDPQADLVEHDGRFFVPQGFVAFACHTQGYVKALIESKS